MSTTFEEIAERNEKAAREILDLVRFMHNDEDFANLLAEKLEREHRTIQQSFFRFIGRVIVKYAENQGPMHSDGRNQAAKDWAKKVAEENPPHFPFI